MSKIIHTSHQLPRHIVTNTDMLEKYPQSENTLQTTGIIERRYVEKHETSTDLAEQAITNLFKETGVLPADIDKVIVGSFTPAYHGPNIASEVMSRLSIENGYWNDVSSACPSYLSALKYGHYDIQSGEANNVIVVGVDTMSKLLQSGRIHDYKTWVIFGDGAWATLLTKSGEKEWIQGIYERTYNNHAGHGKQTILNAARIHSVISPDIWVDWQLFDFDGSAIYRICVEYVPEHIFAYLQKKWLHISDFEHIILHQANQRMLDHIGKRLWLEWTGKVLSNIAYVGNTASASIPILLSQYTKDNTIKKWDRALLCSFGAGINISLIDTYL